MSLLPGFFGIEKEREIKPVNGLIVIRLIELGNQILENYTMNDMISRRVSIWEYYTKVYNKIKSDAPVFSEKDLDDYVISQSNHDFGPNNSLFQGIYTSCLLELLTRINQSEGKRTKVHINGKGNKFPFLFGIARTADEVIIEHFVGDSICRNMVEVDTLVLQDNSGDDLARHIKNAKTVISRGNHGDYLCGGIAYAENMYSINDDCVNLWSGAGFNGHINFGALVNPKFNLMHCATDIHYTFSQIKPYKFMPDPEWKYCVEKWIWGHMTKRDYHKENPLIDKLQETNSIDDLKKLCNELHDTYKL
jgi:hypothetical protein